MRPEQKEIAETATWGGVEREDSDRHRSNQIRIWSMERQSHRRLPLQKRNRVSTRPDVSRRSGAPYHRGHTLCRRRGRAGADRPAAVRRMVRHFAREQLGQGHFKSQRRLGSIPSPPQSVPSSQSSVRLPQPRVLALQGRQLRHLNPRRLGLEQLVIRSLILDIQPLSTYWAQIC